jgi:hypothetical protein
LGLCCFVNISQGCSRFYKAAAFFRINSDVIHFRKVDYQPIFSDGVTGYVMAAAQY